MILESIIFLIVMLVLLRADLKMNIVIVFSVVGLLMLQLIIPQSVIITLLVITAIITNINLRKQHPEDY